MRRLLICFDVHGWSYHRRAVALKKFAPPNWDVKITCAKDIKQADLPLYDLIFQLEQTAGLGFRAIVYRELHHWHWKTDPPVLVYSFNTAPGRHPEYWPLLYASADFSIINSKAMWEYVSRPVRTCAISNGVDTDVFRVKKPWRDRAPRVIWTGGSTKAKGKQFNEVLRFAEKELKKMGIDPAWRPVRTAAETRTIFDTKQMVNWYNSAQFIAVPSVWEGSSNTLLEGMACGCIPICTPVGCAPELIVDGESGFFIKAGSVDSFLDGFKRALDHPDLHGMSERLAQKMKDEWCYKVRAPYFFKLFDALVDGRKVEPFFWQDKQPNEI